VEVGIFILFLKTLGERDQRCWLLRWCSQKEMVDCDGTERGDDDVAQPRASKQRSANLKRAKTIVACNNGDRDTSKSASQ
jgi:hypothetical protein